ncbi:hypothetical protein Ancab_035376, partial [Ancistrocladus abbreviatus]
SALERSLAGVFDDMESEYDNKAIGTNTAVNISGDVLSESLVSMCRISKWESWQDVYRSVTTCFIDSALINGSSNTIPVLYAESFINSEGSKLNAKYHLFDFSNAK